MIEKQCTKCGTAKPLTEFYKRADRSGLSQFLAQCKPCRLAYIREWQASPTGRVKRQLMLKRNRAKPASILKVRDRRYRRQYGSTITAYTAQVAAQGGVCAICRRPPTATGKKHLAFDHDHVTGLTRGALCQSCNAGLGCFRDQPDRLEAAIKYLTEWAGLHQAQKVVNE